MTDLEKLIEAASDALLKAFATGQKKLAEIIQKWLLKIDSKGGKVLSTKANERLLIDLQSELEKAMKQAGFGNFVKEFLSDFEKVNAYTAAIQKDRNNVNLSKDFLTQTQRLAVEITANNLVGQGMAARLAEPIQRRMFESIALGGDLSSLLKGVKDELTATDSLVAKRYIQISRDALGQYNGLLQAKIAKEYNLNAIEYVGSLVEKSRPQCVRWVEKEVILLKDLPSEIEWAEKYGSGLIEGTNEKNFLINRGGHNCRHEAIPTRA